MRLSTLAVLTTTVIATGAVAIPAHADHGSLPPGRAVTHYTVRPGDTATELAVRFHAWSAELISHNHLDSSATLVPGQRIEIPVVSSVVPDRSREGDGDPAGRTDADRRLSAVADAGRSRVRDTVARVARRRGVDPELALAVSWQEAGWRNHHVSEAGALGAMQVLPSTADWMEWYVGQPLRPRRLHDNALTGVTLLKVLAAHTGSRRHRLGAYYQGLAAVDDHGLYPETRRYVADVLAIERRLEQGLPPG